YVFLNTETNPVCTGEFPTNKRCIHRNSLSVVCQVIKKGCFLGGKRREGRRDPLCYPVCDVCPRLQTIIVVKTFGIVEVSNLVCVFGGFSPNFEFGRFTCKAGHLGLWVCF